MIAGIHALLYAPDAAAARAFFRDVLELPALDEGDGWLYFALPPAELACHPGEGATELYLMCTDIEATRVQLEAKGVEFTQPVSDEGWGLLDAPEGAGLRRARPLRAAPQEPAAGIQLGLILRRR